MTDKEYEFQRNRLIPQATSSANRLLDEKGCAGERRIGVDGNEYEFNWFSYFFHREMNRMAFEAGLRKWK